MSDSSTKITAKDVYKTFWRCRDLEIQSFWQRAVFLGTFMALTYTGYGVLLLKLLEFPPNEMHVKILNLVAVGIASIGMVLSAVWILLGKGSKAWYEWYEDALTCFHNENPQGIIPEELKDYAAFSIIENPGFHAVRQPRDSFFISCNAGPFSPSKIIILLGQLSFWGWLIVAFAHIILLSDFPWLKGFIHSNALHIAGVALVATLTLILFGLRPWAKSKAIDQ